MSYDTLVVDYGDNQQVRFYSSPIFHGEELEKIKERNAKIRDIRDRRKELLLNGTQIELDLSDVVVTNDDPIVKVKRDVLKENNVRAKNVIYELARANTWEYFITLTFDPNKVDRHDYDQIVKKVSGFFNYMRKKSAPDLKYLVVPEFHSDGWNYHFHGLLANTGDLVFIDSGLKTKDNDIIYNIRDYNLGFTTATRVIDTDKVTHYVCKYITKDMNCHLKGKKRYLCSLNCTRPVKTSLKLDPEERVELLNSLGEIKHSKTSNGYKKVNYFEF